MNFQANRKYYEYIALVILGLILGYLLFHGSESIKYIRDKKKEAELYLSLKVSDQKVANLKNDMILKDKQVAILSNKRNKIHYITKFDTLATIDTVIVELVKCDSVVVLLDSIESIQNLKQQDCVNALNEVENKGLKKDTLLLGFQEENKSLAKENKKLKRKIILTKIGSVALVIGTIVLIIAL